MKRIIFMSAVLLLASSLAWAVSYSSFLEVSNGISFSFLRDDISRTRYYMTVKADPAGLSFGKNSISIPVSASYYSESRMYGNYFLHSNIDIGIGLSYRYQFTDLLAIKAEVSSKFRYYYKIEAAMAAIGTAFSLEFHPAKEIAITLPFEITMLKDEADLNIGIGFMAHFGGEK